MQALISDGLAHVSDEVYAEMLAKHPQSSHPSLPVGPCPLPEAEGVVGALKSFPSGSASAPFTFRANHIKEAVFGPSPDRARGALQALVDVVNHLCAGHVPSGFAPPLWSFPSLLLEEGSGFRPIAVGEVLCHLTLNASPGQYVLSLIIS